MHEETNLEHVEPLLTLSAAARRLGLPIFKVRRAAKNGFFPTYTLSNKRKLVLLSEVLAAVKQSGQAAPNKASGGAS